MNSDNSVSQTRALLITLAPTAHMSLCDAVTECDPQNNIPVCQSLCQHVGVTENSPQHPLLPRPHQTQGTGCACVVTELHFLSSALARKFLPPLTSTGSTFKFEYSPTNNSFTFCSVSVGRERSLSLTT